MTSDKKTLNGLAVLVTRPVELAHTLRELVEQAGGRAVAWPVISIEPATDQTHLDQLLASLDDYDIAIFISPSAVRKTFEHIQQLPSQLKVAAVGSSTQAHLEQHGANVVIQPDGHNTESLLEHAALQAEQIKAKKIIIFRGEGGRALLGDTLIERGAHIDYAEVYRRCPAISAEPLSAQHLEQIDVITVTSNEGLSNLHNMCSDPEKLTSIALLVPGERTAAHARELGFKHIIEADNATDRSFMSALVKWHSQTN